MLTFAAMQSNNSFEQGKIILIDKPINWTSFDVVRKVRNLVKTKKVGHAGTLDPLATGLLIICTGKFTKRINEFMAQEKEYTGQFTLGATTPTYHLESIPSNIRSCDHPADEETSQMTSQSTGENMQSLATHSAIKQNAKRVYELARQGTDV